MAVLDSASGGGVPQAWPGTVTAALVSTAAARPGEVALRWRRPGGGWGSWTWGDYAERAARIAAGLRQLGVGRGDRVLLMTHNRPEFHAVDMATLLVGAVPVSVYNSSSAEEVAYVTTHADAVVAVVENAQYLDRFLQTGGAHGRLRQLVVVSETEETVPSGVVPFQQLLEAGSTDLVADAGAVRPQDLATLIYTSGTTGPPKAVEITHANVAWTVRSLVQAVGHHVASWRMISFLPMAHVAERVATHYLHAFEGTEVTTCHDPRFILEYLHEVRPQAIFAIPLVWEKAYRSIRALAAADPDQRQAFEAALEVGRQVADARAADRAPSPGLAAQWNEADRLLSVVRDLAGMDQVELAVSAAAPIAPEIVVFFRSLGVPLSELYGLSESTGPLAWDPYRVRPGDVGHPIPGCEVRLTADGEVLGRGGNVFAGYFKDPAKTAEAIDPDGWLHTGDLGVLEDGRLRIVGRKKDLIVTTGGENVSPSTIETALRSAPLVGQACVAGDRRPYLVALLTVDPDALGAWAGQRDRVGMATEDLLRLPELREEVARQVGEVNRRFSRIEQVRRFAVLDHDWLADSDVLTATMKVKRERVLTKYAAEIDALYG